MAGSGQPVNSPFGDSKILLLAFLLCLAAAIWGDWSSHWQQWCDQIGFSALCQLPMALALISPLALWYSRRRWQELEANHRKLAETAQQLKQEVAERRYAEEHAHLLSATKNEILENEFLRSEKLEKVSQLGDQLAAALNIEQMQTIAIKGLQQLLQEHTVAVLFRDTHSKQLHKKAAWGPDCERVCDDLNLHECHALQLKCAYQDQSNTQQMHCDQANLTGVKAVACYPITCRDHSFGVVHLRSDRLTDRLLSREDEKLLKGVCDSIGLHFYNALLRAELSMASHRDPLTGLLNRRGLGNSLKREIKAALQQQYPVAIAMLDIDHFKQYNDTYGHQEGDQAIRFVAEALAGRLRSRDILARFGGEEFILVLPNTDKATALKKLTAMLSEIERDSAQHPHCQRVITLSGGVAGTKEDGNEQQQLIKCADLALYAAKKAGRNRVLTYQHGTMPG